MGLLVAQITPAPSNQHPENPAIFALAIAFFNTVRSAAAANGYTPSLADIIVLAGDLAVLVRPPSKYLKNSRF